MKRSVRRLMVIMCAIWGMGFISVSMASSTLPLEVKHYGSIPYLTGGVGLDEREALQTMGRDYNLKLSFAVTRGNYLGDVQVIIKDLEGRTILEGVSDGPWFYADLPTGKYQVMVETEGQRQNKTVYVDQNSQSVVNFFWK